VVWERFKNTTLKTINTKSEVFQNLGQKNNPLKLRTSRGFFGYKDKLLKNNEKGGNHKKVSPLI